MSDTCDYHGCGGDIAEAERTNRGMRFCWIHRGMFKLALERCDAKGMLAFWIQAHGGATRLAEKMMGSLNEVP